MGSGTHRAPRAVRRQRATPAPQATGRHRSAPRPPRTARTAVAWSLVATAGVITPWTLLAGPDDTGAGTPAAAAGTEPATPSTPPSTPPGTDRPAAAAAGGDELLREQPRRRAALSRDSRRTPPEKPVPAWLVGCDTSPQETSAANGLLADDDLCELPDGGFHLRGDAAAAWAELAVRYEKRFGEPMAITDAYRSLEAQQLLYARKPGLAARPGTSNHGWGVALDLGGGVETYGSAEHQWMLDNAPANGWVNPDWARQTGSKPEPWHWEYVGS